MKSQELKREKFIHRAIQLAMENVHDNHGGPFGALVAKNGKIIAEGRNGVTAKNDPTAHAEIIAIRKACEILGTHQLEDCELYSSCEPCPMCLGAIYWARPKAVYYAAGRQDAAKALFDDGYIYEECQKNPEERKIPFIHMPHDKASEVFVKWIENEKKIHY